MNGKQGRRLSDVMAQSDNAGNRPDKKTSVRATKKDVEERTGTIFDLIIEGKRRSEICAYAAETWGLSERSAERYITRANGLFEKHAVFRREMALGKALARIDKLYSEMLAVGDRRGALQAVREEADLLGLRINRTAMTDSEGRDLVASPKWIELRAILIQVLVDFPEAHQAVLDAIAPHEGG